MNNETLTNLAAAYRALMDASGDYYSVWSLTPLVLILCGLVIGLGGCALANKVNPISSENTKAQESRNNKFTFAAFGSALGVFIAFYFVGEYQEKIFFEQNKSKIEMALDLLQVDREDPAYGKAFESATSAKQVLKEAASTIEPAMDNLFSKKIEEDLKAIGSDKPVLAMLQEGIDETASAHILSNFFVSFGVVGGLVVVAAIITLLDKIIGSTAIKVALGLFMLVGIFSGVREGNMAFQEARFVALSPETKQISEKVVQLYNQYQIYPGQLMLNPAIANSLISEQVKGIRSARFVSDPKALQPESRIAQVVSKWNLKAQS